MFVFARPDCTTKHVEDSLELFYKSHPKTEGAVVRARDMRGQGQLRETLEEEETPLLGAFQQSVVAAMAGLQDVAVVEEKFHKDPKLLKSDASGWVQEQQQKQQTLKLQVRVQTHKAGSQVDLCFELQADFASCVCVCVCLCVCLNLHGHGKAEEG